MIAPFVSCVLAVFGACLCYLWPIPIIPNTIPEGAGQYAVGCVDYEYQGSFNNSTGLQPNRIIIGRLFYPCGGKFTTLANSSAPRRTPYFWQRDTRVPKAMCDLFHIPALFNFIAHHWTCIDVNIEYAALMCTTTNSTSAGPLGTPNRVSTASQLPVIVYSHGLSGTRELSTSMAMALAAQGYIIACVEHTDRSCALARFMNTDTISYDDSYDALEKQHGTAILTAARWRQTRERVLGTII